jgi:hypothetical protein
MGVVIIVLSRYIPIGNREQDQSNLGVIGAGVEALRRDQGEASQSEVEETLARVSGDKRLPVLNQANLRIAGDTGASLHLWLGSN